MRNLIVVCVVVVAISSAVFGEPELKGTPSELTAYLRGLPQSVTLIGESKVEVQAEGNCGNLNKDDKQLF